MRRIALVWAVACGASTFQLDLVFLPLSLGVVVAVALIERALHRQVDEWRIV